MKNKQLIALIVAAVVFVFVGLSSVLVNNISGQTKSRLDLEGYSFSSNTLPSTPHIGVVKVEGTIMDSENAGLFSEGYNHQKTLELIDDLKNSSSNKGILLYVNSPGGSVTASDDLYLKLKEYTLETQRPVWTYMADQACSGGYYISMASEKIYSNRNTWTGSIGVIISFLNYKEMFEKIGIKGVYITSGDNKAMGAGDIDLTVEQQNILQGLVDESYNQFVDIVADGRNMPATKVKEIADGRIYSAKQALDNGLIDEIATYEDMKKTFSAQLDDAEIYTPEKNNFFGLGSLFSYASKLKTRSDTELVMEFVEKNGKGVPMYYAMPGQY